MGGKFLLKLNMDERPIVNKYCEGKLKRTVKTEWKRTEILKSEKFKKNSKVLGGDNGKKQFFQYSFFSKKKEI
jgi:hypothetical protein